MMNRLSRNRMWTVGSAGVCSILIIAYIHLDKLIAGVRTSEDTLDFYARVVLILGLGSILVSAIATFKSPKWFKVVPIVTLLVAVGIASMAAFVASFRLS